MERQCETGLRTLIGATGPLAHPQDISAEGQRQKIGEKTFGITGFNEAK